MKDRRYANRGAPFEEFIRFANDRYAQKKVAMIQKVPTEFIPIRNASGKVCSVKVEHKSTVDFLGRYKQHPIAIEAKNTNTDSIRWDAVQEHQAIYMEEFTEQPGTIGIVLVSFNLKRYFAIPWAFWKAAYNERVRRNRRTTTVTVSAFGTTWDIPKKNSVRIDELHPAWEIPAHDFTYGLDYLKKAEQYITPNQQEEA